MIGPSMVLLYIAPNHESPILSRIFPHTWVTIVPRIVTCDGDDFLFQSLFHGFSYSFSRGHRCFICLFLRWHQQFLFWSESPTVKKMNNLAWHVIYLFNNFVYFIYIQNFFFFLKDNCHCLWTQTWVIYPWPGWNLGEIFWNNCIFVEILFKQNKP